MEPAKLGRTLGPPWPAVRSTCPGPTLRAGHPVHSPAGAGAITTHTHGRGQAGALPIWGRPEGARTARRTAPPAGCCNAAGSAKIAGQAPTRRRGAAFPGDLMALDHIPTGSNPPDEINVVIEIPKDSEPVKYEVDKHTGAIFVDRVLSTPMRYPCNYGYVPDTICGDGDPADVMVILPLPLVPGSVIRCRPVGVLKMTDEAGSDEKLLAVPEPKVFAGYAHITDIDQVSSHWMERIGHFFEHYKDLEKGKWVKLDGWEGVDAARREILESVERFEASPEKLNF